MRRWIYGLLGLGIGTVLSLCFMVQASVTHMNEQLQATLRLFGQLAEETNVQTLTASWKSADGITRTVTTVRNQGPPLEPSDVWHARHNAEVQKHKDEFPPG